MKMAATVFGQANFHCICSLLLTLHVDKLLIFAFLICLDLWRHPWPILRFDGAIQSGWGLPQDKLPLHGGLRGPWVLLS